MMPPIRPATGHNRADIGDDLTALVHCAVGLVDQGVGLDGEQYLRKSLLSLGAFGGNSACQVPSQRGCRRAHGPRASQALEVLPG